jgi:hypothetical protein
MAQIFISYSRVDSAFVDSLIRRVQQAFPHLSIWHDRSSLIGGDDWWEEILKAIAESDVFVYVLSNESVQSRYCQAEFTEARRLQKRVITIQARDRTQLTDKLSDIQFVDMKHGTDDPDALPRLYAAIAKQLGRAKRRCPLWRPATPKPEKESPPSRAADSPEVDTPVLARPTREVEVRMARVRVLIVVIVVTTVIVIFGLWPNLFADLFPTPPAPENTVEPNPSMQLFREALSLTLYIPAGQILNPDDWSFGASSETTRPLSDYFGLSRFTGPTCLRIDVQLEDESADRHENVCPPWGSDRYIADPISPANLFWYSPRLNTHYPIEIYYRNELSLVCGTNQEVCEIPAE